MDQAEFTNALELIKKGESIKSTARRLNINYQILYNHVKGINKSFIKGKPKLLPDDVENELINVVSYLASRNMGLNYRRFIKFASDIYKSLHPNIKEEDMPSFSSHWWKDFKSRHPKFKGFRSRKSDITKLEMYSHKDAVKTFFTNYCKLLHYYPLFDEKNIWNADETGSKQLENHSYIISKSQPNIASVSGKNKRHITILPCINASGDCAPPLFIFQGDSYGSEDLKYFTHSNVWGTATASGFINEKVFLDWFTKFINWLNLKRNKTDIHLLIIDNLKSHISFDIVTTAKKNYIELLALPANCTHIIQPLDVNLFKKFKSKLRDKLPEKITELSVNQLDNQTYVKLISEIWPNIFSIKNIKRSFELIGICPLNPQIVYDRMEKKSLNLKMSNINKDSEQKGYNNNENDLPTENSMLAKTNMVNIEVLNELDKVKKQLAILQAQFMQLQSETVIKKTKRISTKITPSRILTSEEAIQAIKDIKDNKKNKNKNPKQNNKKNKQECKEDKSEKQE